MLYAVFISSGTAIPYDRDVPWNIWIATPMSPGIADLMPCGMTTRKKVSRCDRPRALEASSCPRATDCRPARMISLEYAAEFQVRARQAAVMLSNAIPNFG